MDIFHVKYTLPLTDLNETSILPTDFLKYQISRKSFLW